MRFRLSCPGCGKSLYVSNSDAGKELLCQACGRRVALPPGLGAPGELTPMPGEGVEPDELELVELRSAEPDDLATGETKAVDGDYRPAQVTHTSSSRLPGRTAPRTNAPQSATAPFLHWRSALIGVAAGVLLASALFLGFLYGRGGEPTVVADSKSIEAPKAEERSTAPIKPNPATQPVNRLVAPSPVAASESPNPTTEPAPAPAAIQESFVLDRRDRATQPAEVVFRPSATQPATQLVDAGLPRLPPASEAAGTPSVTQAAPGTQPTAVATSQPSTAPAPARPRFALSPVPVPAGKRSPQQLDQQIDEAIRKATNYLLTSADVDDTGRFALAAYAAIAAAQATNDPRFALKTDQMRKLVEKLKSIRYETTYTRAIRAAALALTDRKEDRVALASDVNWLIDAHQDGNYTYGPQKSRSSFSNLSAGDNSNSQYGLLGVWAGAEAGVEVPRSYWQAVEGHWKGSQTTDGRWGYMRGMSRGAGGTMTMTCAGIASIFITYDYLHADQFVSRYSTLGWPPELTRSLEWLSRGDNVMSVAKGTGHTGYACYGLERVGLATGLKYLGKHDWYRELAEMMVDSQAPGGNWGRGDSGTITTSYFVLFLARGRHPVLANKLLHEGAWSNRPRDLANVARFATKMVERPLNWQVVNLERPGTDWLDAPILYLPSHKPVPLKPADVDKVREYIDWGGLVFLHADGGSAAYTEWAEKFAGDVCRGAKLVSLPPNLPLYNVAYKLPATVRLKAVSNGSRLLVVLAVDDHAGAWQVRSDKTKATSFQLFGNLFAYATGNVPPRNRVDTTYIEPVLAKADNTLTVARLSYDGNWDPEPGAWLRFGRQFQWETGLGVNVVSGNATELPPKASLVHLTGTQTLSIDAGQAGALGSYVRNGGVLMIDACGGNTEFSDSIEQKLLPIAFPGMTFSPADLTLPPFAKSDPTMSDLSARKLRPFTTTKMDRRARPIMIGQYGKGVVIFSPLDLTTGLLGTHVWGVMGHTPDYAKGVMKNILIWAGTMRPVE